MQSTLVRCLQGATSLDEASDKTIFCSPSSVLVNSTVKPFDGKVDDCELQRQQERGICLGLVEVSST
jgi:hypothetical protein